MAQVKFVNALGIDVGARRIGVARVNAVAKIPEPLGTFMNDQTFPDAVKKLISEHDVDLIVIGSPRNLQGEETPQTNWVKDYVENTIRPLSDLPIIYQDETLTSVAAGHHGHEAITRFGLDSLAAVEILSDFIKNNQG